MSFPSKRYQRRVGKALDRALKEAKTDELDIGKERLIVFSDHHKGVRDGADDFRESENAYHAALGYYFEAGHILAVLGDVEELWENDRQPVIDTYEATLKLERAFQEAVRTGQDANGTRRYWRFWGNHDDDWRFPELVKKYMEPLIHGITVHESLLLTVKENGKELGRILFAHGHQGTLVSDQFGALSRIVVRRLWRPIQRRTRINLNTPSRDWNLRKKHNVALYNWAVKQEGLVLIAGHTHHPVFSEHERIAELESELENAKEGNKADAVAMVRAELEYERVFEARRGFTMDQPCYFNTGCCCFADGDVTGLEINKDGICLVRWLDDEGKPQPKYLTKPLKFKHVFERVKKKGEGIKKVNMSEKRLSKRLVMLGIAGALLVVVALGLVIGVARPGQPEPESDLE